MDGCEVQILIHTSGGHPRHQESTLMSLPPLQEDSREGRVSKANGSGQGSLRKAS